jgi:ABC-type amino acid transport substrate-binding protein
MTFRKLFFIGALFFTFGYVGYLLLKKNTLRPAGELLELKVGIYDNCPPYAFINENKLVGYDIDVMVELGKRMSKAVSFVVSSDEQVLDMLRSGAVHIMCMRPTATRIDNRVVVSDCYNELMVPVANTLYELEEDGTFDDSKQRWNCIKK